jgi:hypothetical protein
MVSLDEYIYLASNKINTEETIQFLETYLGPLLTGPNVDANFGFNLSDLPFDEYGFPKVLPETNDNYFQMNGFWYNGGNESTEGNNPHFGTYDYGRSYISQFECFVPDFNSLLTGSSIVTIQENHFNNYNEGTFIFDQTGLPVPYYGTTYADILNGGLVTNAIVSEAGLTYVGGSNSPLYGRPSGDTFSMKLSFSTGTKLCEICNYELIYGADGIVYVKGDPNTQLIDQNCCQTYWLPVSPSNPTVVCPNSVDLVISSASNILGPCVVIDSATNMSVLESCCNKDSLGFDVAWNGKNCVDTSCVSLLSPLGTSAPATAATPTSTGSPIPMVFNASSLFSGTRGGVFSTFGCYWCPPDEFVTLVCNVDEYLSLLSPVEVNQLALSLGWDDISNPVTYLNSVLSTFFTTYGCLYLDSLNVPINNQACCELKGGVWTLDSSSRQNYCVQPIISPCGNNIVNNNHVYVNSRDGSLTSQECCRILGHEWVDGNISIIGEPSQQDGVALSFVNSLGLTNYCTACPTQLKSVDDCSVGSCTLVIKDNITDTNLSQQCCTDYGFIYDSVYNRCLRCASVVNYESSYPYTITNVDTTNLTETCCTGVSGWFGIADINGVNSLINRCYQCPPIYYYTSPSDTVPITNTNYTVIGNELLYGGTSLSQTCCNNYNSEVGTVTWDVSTQKCLVPAVTPPAPASFQIRVGTIPCNGGICGAYGGTGSPGPFITVYVLAGQTPATAPVIYTNSLLTVILTPPFFEYGGKLYSNIGGSGTLECILGSGC